MDSGLWILDCGFWILDFNALFINDCARTQFTYVLIRNANECRPFPEVNKVRISASSFED